jgi:regulator of protease activity HflC (stomatin/prohibitin superfamily)
MMENVLDIPSQDAISKDNASVRVDAVCYYQIIDAARAAYQVNNLTLSIRNLVLTGIRNNLGSMDLDDMLSQRNKINMDLMEYVDDATTPWGTKITRIEIKDISPPKDLQDSMNRQMKAERDKRALILEAEGKRQSDILKAEGEKQSAILSAEGEKEAAILRVQAEKQAIVLKAEGEKQSAILAAEARERSALAEAKATQVLSQAIDNGNTQAVNYFIAQKYVEAFSTIANGENSKVIFMPMEASSLVSSLGGITELVKNTLEKDKI